MRHVGKAEAAIAIGVDRRAAGKMRLADDDPLGHRGRHVFDGCAAAGTRLAVALGLGRAGRSLNRMSSGPATKIDE